MKLKNASAIPLTLMEYQERACASNQFRGTPTAIDQLRFGFFGEIGGVLSAVKKSHREFGAGEASTVLEELGDALWYLATVAQEYKHSLDAVGSSAIADLTQRYSLGNHQVSANLTFDELDGLVAFCISKIKTEPIETHLQRLGARAGELLVVRSDLATMGPIDTLGLLLSDMFVVCVLFSLKMKDVAVTNLQKFESRWPTEPKYLDLFDDGMPPFEKFPREFKMMFIERETANGKRYVIQQMHGVNIGDRLTDNVGQPDGYRFHDVFHLAYIAHLGWSPVIRGLLKLKRKSNADLDENQDGARAMIIEEGIVAWIFNHAVDRDLFMNAKPGKLEYGLLKQVHDMVKSYEVADCPLWQWERAILDGFKVFREITEAGGGAVNVNLKDHTIEFERIPGVGTQVDLPSLTKRPIIVGSARPSMETS
jgi:NTP pyrophosphatase (non-canonical NTP hydrolase)